MFSLWLSIHLPSFARPSPFHKLTRQLQQTWQGSGDSDKNMSVHLSLTHLFWHEPTPVWGNVCARTIYVCVCVFCASGEKLCCVYLLAYANATGECGSWGKALLRLLAARKFCVESDEAAEANFNFFFKRTLRNSCFCRNAGCVFPDEKHTGAHAAISVSGW